MSDNILNCNIIINPSCEKAVFLGRECSEILQEEFKACLNDEKGKNFEYTAEIPEECPLVNTEYLKKILSYMEKTCTSCIKSGNLKIYKNGCENEKSAFYDNGCEMLTSCAGAKGKVYITNVLRERIIDRHIDNGVLILSPQSVYIDYGVTIESGVTIYQNNMISGKTSIGQGSILMPNNSINNSIIGENVTLSASTLNEAVVGGNTTVGPNAYLRPHAEIGKGCRIGDFVEIKNARIGDGTKVSHLAYVGDAAIGENCNIGCGVIFVNYNGKTKNKSAVGSNSFIGSNCNIIAPVNIGEGVFVAAGTTVSKDIPSDAFCIGRMREQIKENGGKKYLK